MKPSIYLIFFLRILIESNSNAQVLINSVEHTIDSITNLAPTKSKKLLKSELCTCNSIYIEMAFNSSNIEKVYVEKKNPEDSVNWKRINRLNIWRVDLLYSQYHESKTYNQRKLNKERLIQLYNYLPRLFTNKQNIFFTLTEQVNAKNAKTAEALVHGIVIYFKHDKPAYFGEDELNEWTNILNDRTLTKDSVSYDYKLKISKKKVETGMYYSTAKNANKDELFKTKGFNRKPETITVFDTVRTITGQKKYRIQNDKLIKNHLDDYAKFNNHQNLNRLTIRALKEFEDSLKRKSGKTNESKFYFYDNFNRLDEVKKDVIQIICDVGKGMESLVLEFLFKNQMIEGNGTWQKSIEHAVFFKSTISQNVKKKESTKKCESENPNTISNAAIDAITNIGVATDATQHILAASKSSFKFDRVYLFTDGINTKVDLNNLKQIKLPVIVITCNDKEEVLISDPSDAFINTDLILLAMQTNGAILTNNSFFYNWKSFRTGKPTSIAGRYYIFKDNKITGVLHYD